MVRRPNAVVAGGAVCQWLSLEEALHHFATSDGPTQSQQHIKPLHWYVASRLVLEGGFHPDEVTPRPPFAVQRKNNRNELTFDPGSASGGERTILGGLKTKNVDVVVTKEGIGPVLAVSCKGMTRAFRNLTNRMEETIGECTNLHITYPAMVFGYMFVVRANRPLTEAAAELADGNATARQLAANDMAILEGGMPIESIVRFHAAMRELTGRRGIRDDVSRYEAVAIAMIEPTGENAGSVLGDFPAEDSPLRIDRFFQTLYLRYDERYVFGAPDLQATTRRKAWTMPRQLSLDPSQYPDIDYEPRVDVSTI